MTQHFLLSKEARTLSRAGVLRLSDEAYAKDIRRFAANNGAPFCSKCGLPRRLRVQDTQDLQVRGVRNSVLADIRDDLREPRALDPQLSAIAIFMNGAKGHRALQLSRDLNVQYKTAFVMTHKIREAMASQMPRELSGTVEVDGAYFGGYVKPRNYKARHRLAKNQSGKRKVVVVMGERQGDAVTKVFEAEADAVPTIRRL